MQSAIFSYSVQGSSHIRKEKDVDNEYKKKFPCQDRSFSFVFPALENDKDENIKLFVKSSECGSTVIELPVKLKAHKTPFKLICVCDGHGGAPYFRSDKGAEFAIQVLAEILTESIDLRFVSAMKSKNYKAINNGLSKGIVERWNTKVEAHLKSNDITKELEYLDLENKSAADQYRNGIGLNSIYGCTLIAYFETEDYWYALQIGDGDLAVSFDGDTFLLPIPKDPKCFLNSTTSICDDEAKSEMRFAKSEYLGKKPKAILCSSDGVGNSFADEEFLKKFYSNITELVNSENDLNKEIPLGLSGLSDKGSGDDVSIAGIVEIDRERIEKKKKRKEAFENARNNIADYEKSKSFIKPYLNLTNMTDNEKIINAMIESKWCISNFSTPGFQAHWDEAISCLNSIRTQKQQSENILGKLYLKRGKYYSQVFFFEEAAKLGNTEAIEWLKNHSEKIVENKQKKIKFISETGHDESGLGTRVDEKV